MRVSESESVGRGEGDGERIPVVFFKLRSVASEPYNSKVSHFTKSIR